MTLEELLQKLTELWDRFTEHRHDGVDSPKISYNNLTDVPGILFTGNIKVLLVGAGGGGSGINARSGGGGGGGGISYDAAHEVIAHIGTDQAYSVVVPGTTSANSDGNNATFHNLTAYGGKGGYDGTGGLGTLANGGAGGAGANPGTGSNGGNGTASSITGSSVYYGGGGGGYGTVADGTGGLGGGGNGDQDGTDGLGGGGGGNGSSSSTYRGGAGRVIISYVTNDFGPCTGGTITVDGINTVHTFVSSGTFTVIAR